jgi:hypothetical protein
MREDDGATQNERGLRAAAFLAHMTAAGADSTRQHAIVTAAGADSIR